MKTLEQILKQTPIYLHDWAEDREWGVIGDFEGRSAETILMATDVHTSMSATLVQEVSEFMKKWKEIKILFASYGYLHYMGEAFVLFEKGGQLFEVNGLHDSIYGLKGQFQPEETTLEALRHRLTHGTLGRAGWAENEFANELKDFLGIKT